MKADLDGNLFGLSVKKLLQYFPIVQSDYFTSEHFLQNFIMCFKLCCDCDFYPMMVLMMKTERTDDGGTGNVPYIKQGYSAREGTHPRFHGWSTRYVESYLCF